MNQPHISAAADDANPVAGEHYTGLINHHDQGSCEVWLANAPESVLNRLHAMHPGVYVIHNDAPRPQSVVLALQDTLDWQALQPEGISIVSTGPSQDGYLRVGVMGDVATAQARLDALYGLNLIRVHADMPGTALPDRVRVDRPART